MIAGTRVSVPPALGRTVGPAAAGTAAAGTAAAAVGRAPTPPADAEPSAGLSGPELARSATGGGADVASALVVGATSLVVGATSLVVGATSLVVGATSLVVGATSLVVGATSLVVGATSLVVGATSLVVEGAESSAIDVPIGDAMATAAAIADRVMVRTVDERRRTRVGAFPGRLEHFT